MCAFAKRAYASLNYAIFEVTKAFLSRSMNTSFVES